MGGGGDGLGEVWACSEIRWYSYLKDSLNIASSQKLSDKTTLAARLKDWDEKLKFKTEMYHTGQFKSRMLYMVAKHYKQIFKYKKAVLEKF